MGTRVVFVLFLGGCFNFGTQDSGCQAGTCQGSDVEGATCDPTNFPCYFSLCSCSPSHIVVCPHEEDLSVPLDLSTQRPRDLSEPDDGGGGFD